MKLGFLTKSQSKTQAKHLEQGSLAEHTAATFLQQQGLILIEKNFRCQFGEIDLVMRDGETLVFVEVRLRANQNFGGAAYSINQNKQQKLSRTAEQYLQLHGDCNCRFDAILMQATDINAVEWIKNAF